MTLTYSDAVDLGAHDRPVGDVEVCQRSRCGIVGSTTVFIDKGVAKIGATEKIQVHGEERCVVDAVDIAQLVVELQAVQERRSFRDAEDVVGEQVAVSVEDASLAHTLVKEGGVTGDVLIDQSPHLGD